MKKILILFFLISFGLTSFAQMPMNGDYTDWEWEDQTQSNWKRKDNIHGWIDINPPFKAETERLGDMAKIYESQDYTKSKGWELAWAQFDGIYPYYILYNQHKGILRAFFYLDNDVPFTHVLATLSFSDVNNPGILAFGNEYADATDKYLNGSNTGADDMISVIIPDVGLRNWCAADFPMFLDNNILNSRYNSKKWQFKFYGCDNYAIELAGTIDPTPPPDSDKQQTISAKKSSVGSGKFDASYAKYLKQMNSVNDLAGKMKKSAAGIDPTSKQFLQNYKETIDGMGNVFETISAVAGISSGFGAVLGFVKILTGTFDEEKSTKPAAVIQYISLKGSMDIKRTLGGNTLKIPGVNGAFTPAVSWNPYNCPVGYFNMSKTPTIKKTKGYNKYGCYDAATSHDDTWLYYNNGISYMYNPLLIKSNHPRTGGYAGKIVKYKFDDNIELVYNNLPGLDLVDVHFAIVGKSKKDENGYLYYDVEEKVLAYHTFIDRYYTEYNVALENPVHYQLNEGYLIIHKFDKENNDVYFGTPYLPMNKLKGVVLEVPEHTDIKLRVVAKFTSDKYDSPIVFQANYNMNVQEVDPSNSEVYFFREQSTFPYSDYYLGEGNITLSTTTGSQYSANTIVMKPGFVGEDGFTAIAINIHPTRGNTVITPVNFNCNSTLKSASIANDVDNYFTNDSHLKNNLSIYPNPSQGIFTVENSKSSVDIESIEIYNSSGMKIYSNFDINSNVYQINLNNQSKGLFLLKVKNSNETVTKRIIIN
ncbi:MAG: T9SS type A sorting domain-containing protein [Bacteroidales bacterium]|nr:T9SS type A sorting domain-containing protein [Bacteroidales bacterium]